MKNTNHIMKIDGLELGILEAISKSPSELFTIERITRLMGAKSNYPAVYRRVSYLIRENILSKSMYGMASQIKINLANERTLSLLSLTEAKKSELFFSRLKGILSSSLREIIKDTKEMPEFKCILIFGSYAKGTFTKESDIDMLIICEYSKFISSENYEQYARQIKSSMMGILKVNELRGGAKINPIVVSSEEHKEMLINAEANVGKEALLNHIILKGYNEYWIEISRCA